MSLLTRVVNDTKGRRNLDLHAFQQSDRFEALDEVSQKLLNQVLASQDNTTDALEVISKSIRHLHNETAFHTDQQHRQTREEIIGGIRNSSLQAVEEHCKTRTGLNFVKSKTEELW